MSDYSIDFEAADPETAFSSVVADHVSCLKPVMFIRRADKEMISDKRFNAEHNRIVNEIPKLPTRYRDAAAKYANAAKSLQLVKGTCYRPGQDPICDGLFNMWLDPGITPLAEKPTIFFEHMKYLFPDARERKLVVQWMAWAVQRPNKKLMFALYIVGEGGTGKSWFGKLFEVLFGEENVTLLDDDDPLKSDFQEFKLHKRLLFVHEIAPDEKFDLVRKLKGFISESTVHINRKNIERAKVENFCNVMGVTNYGLKVARNDRRALIVRANDDAYGVGEATTQVTEDYYTRLFDCIGTPAAPGDEARRILHYLSNPAVLSDFAGKLVAPPTAAKDEVAAAGETKTTETINEAREARTGVFRFSLFTVAQVMSECATVGRSDNIKTIEAETAKAMVMAGCRRIVFASLNAKVKSPQVVIDGQQMRLWAASKSLAEKYGKMTLDQVRDAYMAERAASGDVAEDEFAN